MNSVVRMFSNFKEFYNEINGATLTGAIDVIVVEQPNGEFQCSPFHVRFGKMGVLRSREKVVDIEVNGEPVDIHMKLGESGEAFFVEEYEEDIDTLPHNLVTSPIPAEFLQDDEALEGSDEIKPGDELQLPLPLPLPRRNSFDLSQETKKEDILPKYENQVSDFSQRRHTDNHLERRDISAKLKEYTTQKIRQEWAEHQEEIFNFENNADKTTNDWSNSTQIDIKTADAAENVVASNDTANAELLVEAAESTTETTNTLEETQLCVAAQAAENSKLLTTTAQKSSANSIKEESKSGKKKRRKKSQIKKKPVQRKASSSSAESTTPVDANAPNAASNEDGDTISVNTNNSVSMDEVSPPSATLKTALVGDESFMSVSCQTLPETKAPARTHDFDLHFFSDTEVTAPHNESWWHNGERVSGNGRPSTPVQSDSEVEITMRPKDADFDAHRNTPSWKWGELPTSEIQKEGDTVEEAAKAQAERNSMLSNMLSFMKKTNKLRKQGTDGGVYLSDLDAESMDPNMAAMYFPTNAYEKDKSPANSIPANNAEDDRESGNGTSLPHSPSSMEGQKSLDSDYDDGNKSPREKYLDFVAMSLCGLEKGNPPSEEDFDQHLVKYSDVCENPNLFKLPNLTVRLNGRFYTWDAACPIILTIITFKKPLTAQAINHLMRKPADSVEKMEVDGVTAAAAAAAGQTKRSWWNWRRSQTAPLNSKTNLDEKDADAATQTTRPNSPDVSEHTLSKTDSNINAENTSAFVENMEDLSQASSKNSNSMTNNGQHERFKKTLRLSSDIIKRLNLKEGKNELEFSVTTAYQGTTRCKCYLYRWKHSDKVVISDVDGTITKSDVLGHILPMVGNKWAQMGVAQLFSKIDENGYKVLYLSARAIGQSHGTRAYLRSIRQGDVTLPDGPVLLNPTSLIAAFHREVIERKPEAFKIACLSDIRDLFPENPFYAGYGNRINDVYAYRAVGIPIMRIFTINAKGELKHELTQTFQSSGYINQSLEVDELFPALEILDYDYKSDVFDDEEEEDELIFSDTAEEEEIDEALVDAAEETADEYSDEYAAEDDINKMTNQLKDNSNDKLLITDKLNENKNIDSSTSQYEYYSQKANVN